MQAIVCQTILQHRLSEVRVNTVFVSTDSYGLLYRCQYYHEVECCQLKSYLHKMFNQLAHSALSVPPNICLPCYVTSPNSTLRPVLLTHHRPGVLADPHNSILDFCAIGLVFLDTVRDTFQVGCLEVACSHSMRNMGHTLDDVAAWNGSSQWTGLMQPM